jgi:glycosyltransferase involved in cell wall biosynthesis
MTSSGLRTYEVALLHTDACNLMGQQRYEHEIFHALQEHASPELRATPISTSGLRSSLRSDLKIPSRVTTTSPLVVQRAFMKGLLRKFDLVHRMDLRLPASPAEVVTVHDVAPLRFPDEGSLPKGAAASLRRAREVIAPSAFAADDIAEALNIDRPTVIHNGVPNDAFCAQPLGGPELGGIGIWGRYILCCGGVTLRKNLRGLQAAWSILRDHLLDVQLVLAGPQDIRRTGLFQGDERVIMPGNLDRGTLLGLMKSATVVVVPSIYEGFGFPAVEAMACGTAVVAARMASLPEICGDGALLCDVEGEAMADAIQRMIDDVDLRERFILAGAVRAHALTWQIAAEEHLTVYRRSLEHGRSGNRH